MRRPLNQTIPCVMGGRRIAAPTVISHITPVCGNPVPQVVFWYIAESCEMCMRLPIYASYRS